MKEKKKKKETLNIRERKFVKGLAAGLPPTTAMRQAGYTHYTATSKAGAKARESKIQATIQELMEKQGLTSEKLLSKLDEGLESTKVISANVIAPNGEGMSDANGMTKDFIDVPDYATRHKYLDTAFKLGSYYPNEKVDVSGAIDVRSIEIKIIG